ncbi:MAG: FAD-dependent oxidoreductase [Elusimicrobiota bacterium]
MQKGNIYIFGAGITGLSAGKALAEKGYKVIIFEKNGFVGGMSATFNWNDYLLDLGPHKIFSIMPGAMREAKILLGEELLTVKKSSRIRLQETFLNYPVGIKDIILGLKPLTAVKFVFDYAFIILKNIISKGVDNTYKDWVINRFGRTIYSAIFGPYAAKIWADPETLHKELAETRIVVPNLYKMFTQMVLGIKDKNVTLHASEFYYAKHGSSVLCESLAKRITGNGGEIRLNEGIKRVNLSGGSVTSFTSTLGKEYPVGKDNAVISTMPLSDLAKNTPAIPQNVRDAIVLLKTNNLILEYLIINKPGISGDNWLFFPEKEYVFNRVFEQKNFSSYMVPQATTALCAEITCAEDNPLWKTSENEIFLKVVNDLKKCGLIKAEDVLKHFDKRLTGTYPIYDLNYKENKSVVFGFLDSIDNFYSIGRTGGFDYTGMLDCLDIGYKTADFIEKKRKNRKSLRDCFTGYIVVD